MNDNLISILTKGNNAIPYKKELNEMTGGALETLVFTQILYWFDLNNQEPFYKFIEPCEHPDYKEGDSWVEELGISRKQFLRIVKTLETNNLITRKTGMDRRTFHTVNVDVVNEKLKGIYISPKRELDKFQKGTYQVTKGDLDISIIKNSETTTETTTENSITPLPPKCKIPEFLDSNLWKDYLAYKKERREKLSSQGIKMKFSEWEKWHKEGIDINQCIRQAMANEWQGVFKPKKGEISEQHNPLGLSQSTLKTLENAKRLGEKLKRANYEV